MNLNLGSLSFNANLENGGGTPAWGTELGQGDGYRFSIKNADDLFTSLVYTSIPDLNNVYCPLGKGGNQRQDYDFVIAGLYSKVYVNNLPVNNARFLLLVVKKLSGPNHVGRRTLKYSPRISYKGIELNQDCFNKIEETLKISHDAAWFIDEINVRNQDELHFTAYVLNDNAPISYKDSEERRKAYIRLLKKSERGSDTEINNARAFNRGHLNEPRQQITYGAPGTGKSFCIDEDVKKYHMNAIRTTFHPDSDYSTFVGAYKPQMERIGNTRRQTILDYSTLVDKFKEYLDAKPVNITKACTLFGYDYHDSIVNMETYGKTIVDLVSDAYKSGSTYDSQVRAGMSVYEQIPEQNTAEKKIVYKYSQQAFLKAYIAAWKDLENPYVLVIEEINRGNCAQIFGDLFQLLDRNDEGFSSYPLSPDTDIMQVLNDEFKGLDISDADAINGLYTEDVMTGVLDGSKLLLPRNLYIWATMNTSDQSLFPIDSAFKRRWEWKYVPISDAHKRWMILVNGMRYDWWSFLEEINKKIWDAIHSEDKKLGYFFCKANAEDGIITADKFVGKVLFYIYNDVFKDYGFDDAIFKDEEDKENPELLFKDFFLPDGKPREVKIQVFLKNLGVKTEAEIEAEVVEVTEVVEDPESQEYEDDGNLLQQPVNESEPIPDDVSLVDEDPTRYSFDGNNGLGKSELALSVIGKYLTEHAGDTLPQLNEGLAAISMGGKFNLYGLLVSAKDLKNVPYNIQKKAYGFFKKERKHLAADGVEFFVNGYWSKDNIQSIIDFARNQGWPVSTEL